MTPKKSDWFRPDGSPYVYDGPHCGAGWHLMMQEVERDLRDPTKKFVAKTELSSGLVVSTVWLGLNQRYSPGRPLIFETMIFTPDGRTMSDMARYATREEAERGHKFYVKKFSMFQSADQVLSAWKRRTSDEKST